jgi:RNA polymerase sigma-70 factor, ECF subfamily
VSPEVPSRRVVPLPGVAGDRALVARLLAGEEQAFRDCYERHAPAVLSLLVRMLRERGKAEEILQETFAAVFNKIAQYRGDARFGTWIVSIAIQRALNALRDRARRIPVADTAQQERGHDSDQSESQLVARDLARRLLGLLDKLTQDKRIAILLHAEGYTAAEIASLTGSTRSTVLARIARGRAELLALATQAGLTLAPGTRGQGEEGRGG